MARDPKPEALPISAAAFADTPTLAIPVAGLLQGRPDLREQLQSAEKWQADLDAYLTSTPPSEPDPQPEPDPEPAPEDAS